MNIFVIQGGIGKHVMFSSLIEKLSETSNEKIIIVSAYPELFKFHPKVEISASFHEPGFYEKYIQNTDNNIIHTEPYYSNYVKGKTHLIEEWAKLNKIEYTKDLLPDIYIDDFAVEESKRFVSERKQFIITQFSGGQSPINMDVNRPHISMTQKRDYPRELAQNLVFQLNKKYPDITILNYALPNESTYNLQGTIQIEAPFLFYVSLLQYCKTYICIDSSLQHFAANRFNKKKGIVLWGGTDPICLGYEKNINLTNAKDNIHKMRPLCIPMGDIFNSDGSPWRDDDSTSMNINPEMILQNVDSCIEFNDKIVEDIENVCKNSSIIEVNEKTRNILFSIQYQIKELNDKYNTVLQSYIASKDKEGNYNLSGDGKKLVKTV